MGTFQIIQKCGYNKLMKISPNWLAQEVNPKKLPHPPKYITNSIPYKDRPYKVGPNRKPSKSYQKTILLIFMSKSSPPMMQMQIFF